MAVSDLKTRAKAMKGRWKKWSGRLVWSWLRHGKILHDCIIGPVVATLSVTEAGSVMLITAQDDSYVGRWYLHHQALMTGSGACLRAKADGLNNEPRQLAR